MSQEEHQAWDVLSASVNQVRLAPTGRVLGLDLAVAHEVARARSCDLAVVSELLQAAEVGLLEALSESAEEEARTWGVR